MSAAAKKAKAPKPKAKKLNVKVRPLAPHKDIVSDERISTLTELAQELADSDPKPGRRVVSPKKPIPAVATPVVTIALPKSTVTFFGLKESKLDELQAPAVYREAGGLVHLKSGKGGAYYKPGGSHTTILLAIGHTKAQHTPMDSAGLRVVATPLRKFRDEWMRAPYDVAKAAERYLKVGQFEVAPRAKAALAVVAAGGDAAAVKAALTRALADEAVVVAPNGSIAHGLITAGASAAAKAKRGGNLPKGRGIGAWVCAQLLAKVDDQKILAQVIKEFPGAKTNPAHLAWYRGKLRREGRLA